MNIFLVDLMWLLAVAVGLGIFFRMVGLPSLVGHVVAGVLVGMAGLIDSHTGESLHVLGSVGVTLLLFLVGLEMNVKEVKKTGSTVLMFFLIQTVVLMGVFWGFSYFVLRQSLLGAALLSVAMTFSSTIVVVKALSEKRDLQSFVGRMSVGVLLLQDVVAIFLLVLMSGLNKSLGFNSILELGVKFGVLFLVINVFGHWLISQIEKHLIKSSEDLVLLSLVWLGISVYFSTVVLGLTPEVGGILAGVSLSMSWGRLQIASKVRTLRDIFLTVFFVLMGLEVGMNKIDWRLVAELTVLVVVAKFFISELTGYWLGLSGKVTLAMSANLTQLSEFSLIVMSFGLANGLWGSEIAAAVTVAGLISMVLSTVLIHESSWLYKVLSDRWWWMKFAGRYGLAESKLKNHVVLLGGDRTGRSVLAYLLKKGTKVLVVDFNQEVVARLKKRGVEAVLADASDMDIVEVTNMNQAKMVISTIKDMTDSLSLLTVLKQKGIEVPVVVDAESAVQAAMLYQAGASYVIFPHFVSGLHLGTMLKKYDGDKEVFKKYRLRQSETLKSIYDGEFE